MGCADQAALDAEVDPQTIAEWTRQVKAERAAALARDASQIRYQTPSRSNNQSGAVRGCGRPRPRIEPRRLITSYGLLSGYARS